MKEEIKKVLKPLAKAGVYSIEIWLLFFSPTFLLPERSWELVQLQAPPDGILSLSSWSQG